MLRGSVELKGPFFTKDVRKVIRANALEMVRDLAEEGEAAVQQSLVPGGGRLTGDYAESIQGRTRSLQGKPWQVTAVVSATRHLEMPGHRGFGLFLETGVKGTRKTSFRGLGIFRRVGAKLRRSSRTRRHDLTRGLN